MPQVFVLSCPVCGAPLKPGDEKCNFCGSYIVIKTDLPRLDRHTLNQSVIQEHILDFRKRVRANTYDEVAHYGLGLAYYSLGLIDEAVDELTQAARLMPENPHIQAQLAVTLRDSFQAGNSAAEIQMNTRLQSALLLDPDHVEANILKAEIFIDKSRFKEAVTVLQSLDLADQSRVKSKLVSTLE